MDHNAARHKLSEYIDGALSAKEQAAIEAHLKSCQTCTEALDELRKTVEMVGQVGEVEPPAWMTGKIMARVRAEADVKRSWYQRLFFPLAVKLPLEMVGVLFLAVTAFTVYQNMQPTTKYAGTPLEKFEATKPAVPMLSRAPEPKIQREPVAPAKKVPQTSGYKALDMKQEYEKPAPPVYAEQPAAPARAKSFAAPTEPVQESKEDLSFTQPQEPAAPAAKREASAPAMGLATGEQPRLAGTARAAKAKAALGDSSAENAADIIMNVKDFDAAEKEIGNAVAVSGGRIVRIAPSGDKRAIIVTIAPDRLEEFLAKLKKIGDVKEKGPASTGQVGSVTIRITMTKN